MAHYVVVLHWTSEGDNGCNVLGVCHTLDEAKEIFQNHIGDERDYADGNGWEIYTDNDIEFDAGEGGYYVNNNTRLFIQEVN